MYPAAYALDCAITALWASIGIRPNAVLGTEPGEIAGAHAAGVFTLDEGLRLAARYGAPMNESSGSTVPDNLDAILGKIVPVLPSILLVNPVTAWAFGPGETLDSTYWSRHAHQPAASDQVLEDTRRIRHGNRRRDWHEREIRYEIAFCMARIAR